MRTVRTKVYQFSELDERAKVKAIDVNRFINVDGEWWEQTYEDAEEVGLKITGFDIGRSDECTGEFQLSAHEVAANIIRDHGEVCGTYKAAQEFLDAANSIELAEGEEYGEGPEYENKMMELEDDFLKALLSEYLIMLRSDYEYLTTDGAIIETIEANEYEFTKDGKPFHK
jgi:hypothetical protein